MDHRQWARLLDSHQPADSRETGHLLEMKALLKETVSPFARTQFQPGHFTASAFVLSPCLTQILLIFHDKLERWLQPGGHIDPEDQTLVQAALRELSEETGLGAKDVALAKPPLLDVDVHEIVANPRKGEPSHAHYDVRVLFLAKTRDATAGSDARALRWVSLEAVKSVETDESVMRAVRKIQNSR